MTAAQAVSRIASGERVFEGSGAAEPTALVEAMTTRAGDLREVSVLHIFTPDSAPYAKPRRRGSFRHTAFFNGPNVRQAAQEGRADFVHDNPAVAFAGSNLVNDPFTIARNDDVVVVNGAIQVDLTGQVNSDSMGTHPCSGIGGQLDFIRGAARSRRGKPIIALPSTAAHGAVSRIAPTPSPGAWVVTSWLAREAGQLRLTGPGTS